MKAKSITYQTVIKINYHIKRFFLFKYLIIFNKAKNIINYDYLLHL